MIFSLQTWTAIIGGSFLSFLAGKIAVAAAEEWARGVVRRYQDRNLQSDIELSRLQLIEIANRNQLLTELALMALSQRDEALQKLEKVETVLLDSAERASGRPTRKQETDARRA